MHAKHSAAETDLKLPLSREQLLALVGEGGGGGSHSGGEEAVARLESVFRRFGCDAYSIWVRCVQALGRS
jgi:ABC-type microcin C transport system duplicated ATPase subunit YejF